MSFESTAQELIVVDPSMDSSMGHGHSMPLIPLEVTDVPEDYPAVVEPLVEVHDEPEPDLEIVLDLPGAPPGTPDPQPLIEVVDEEHGKDEDEAKDKGNKKNPKWDWESRGAKGFIAWVKERLDDVPKHSGYDSAGLKRAVAYLERVDNEVSKAMRLDLEGELDANQIEKVRSVIDNGIERLHERLDKVKSSKKKGRKKKADLTEGLVKEAQKITGVQGVFVTVDLLTSHIARVCINGMVSAGHDIEDLFERQAKYFGLDKRERAQVIQLLDDMGYAMRRDRGFMPDEDVDVGSSDNMDWAANYNSSSEVWGKDR